jgi:hypothetical protein
MDILLFLTSSAAVKATPGDMSEQLPQAGEIRTDKSEQLAAGRRRH